MDRSRIAGVTGGVLAGLVGGGLLIAASSMTVSIIDRSGTPVEAISGTTVAVSVGAAVLVAAGVLLFALTPNRDVVLLAAGATILLLVSILGLFSIGILVMPLAIGSVYLLVRRSAGRAGLAPALAAGPLMALALSVLFVVWIQPPLVECTEGGAATNFRPWWSAGTASGQGSSTVSGDTSISTGNIETPSGDYVFRCRGGELTQFRPIGSRR